MARKTVGYLGDALSDIWQDIPDYFLGPFWVGNFADLSTKDFGSNEFHGRFHPAIPYVAMKRFTKPGDTVWDCFAGSGTTLDVGNRLDRIVVATDLQPHRRDIEKRDARYWHPGEKTVDLGIMHPPYWDIIDFGDSMSQANSLDDYSKEFEKCLSNMHIALKEGHVLVIVVGEIWKHSELYPLEYIIDKLVKDKFGYRRLGRIVKDFGETKGGKVSGGPQNARLWKYRLLKWGYFRIGIDTILFYQKV